MRVFVVAILQEQKRTLLFSFGLAMLGREASKDFWRKALTSSPEHGLLSLLLEKCSEAKLERELSTVPWLQRH